MIVLDASGKVLQVGSRVACGGDPGTVSRITDWDGDVDDYGRSVGIRPEVSVEFDDGSDDAFRCYLNQDGETVCDDVEVTE